LKIGIIDYLKIGLKLAVVSIVSAIIWMVVYIPLLILSALSAGFMLIFMIILIPIALVINGWTAYKIWKWS